MYICISREIELGSNDSIMKVYVECLSECQSIIINPFNSFEFDCIYQVLWNKMTMIFPSFKISTSYFPRSYI